MDIAAHALWAGAGALLLQRRCGLAPRVVVATVVLATLADVVHLLPVLAWVVLGEGTVHALRDYVLATPGHEPPMPGGVLLVAHHLHCALHSAVVAGAVTLAGWLAARRVWFPLWGWWSHILIDVPTHAAEYYAVPVLYPFSDRGFDGVAWNTTGFMVLNYALLAAVWAGLLAKRLIRISPGAVQSVHARDMSRIERPLP
jgi:hypothetical protein